MSWQFNRPLGEGRRVSDVRSGRNDSGSIRREVGVRGMTEQEFDALQNAIPQEPTKHELGGGYYYTCHWLSCNEQLRRWWRYCPVCGQKIRWKGEDE